MPDKSKEENEIALKAAGIPRKSFSKDEFCARHGISPGLYKKLRNLGLGPHETHLLERRVIITREDEEAWLRMVKERDSKAKAEA